MSKSYEQKLKAYRATCRNMASLETLNAKFWIASGNAELAGHFARRAARWALTAFTELVYESD